jgi:hypothetical protein
MLVLENKIKSGTSWFYWISALSILNTFIFFMGGSVTFTVGLGITQLIDGLVYYMQSEFSGDVMTILRIIGFGLDILIAGGFALCGFLGRKRKRGIVITGMVFYLLDGILCLYFGDWLSAIFHLLALAGLWAGQKAIKDLAVFEKSLNPNSIPVVND